MNVDDDAARLNELRNESHRRAVQAMYCAREFWGRGEDEIGHRAYETALTYYIRAGLDPAWFDDGGLGSIAIKDVAQPRGLTVTELHDDFGQCVVLTDEYYADNGERHIVADADALQDIEP